MSSIQGVNLPKVSWQGLRVVVVDVAVHVLGVVPPAQVHLEQALVLRRHVATVGRVVHLGHVLRHDHPLGVGHHGRGQAAFQLLGVRHVADGFIRYDISGVSSINEGFPLSESSRGSPRREAPCFVAHQEHDDDQGHDKEAAETERQDLVEPAIFRGSKLSFVSFRV